jgi:nucleotide-binding universal stress UspA family protein
MTDTVPDLPFATEAHVAVGIDGTEASLHAVRWAVDEAGKRAVPLLIVHAAPYAAGAAGALRAHAGRILGRAYTVAHRRNPALAVHTARLDADPAVALVEVAGHADLVVLGMPGDGQVGSGGSVALRVAAHATGAVAVVHSGDHEAPAGPVVAGIGDPRTDAGVVAVAHGFARRRRAPLHVVHVALSARDAADARDSLEPLTARWAERDAGVPVALLVVHGRPLAVLVEQAVGARLLVVGPAKGGLRGMLGSTSRALLRAAPCPVVVTGHSDVQPAGGPARDPHARAELW